MIRPDFFVSDVRFIPACAGNSVTVSPAVRPAPVHPRVCGELDWAETDANDDTGSSPRVRGTHHRGVKHHRVQRFIPACAGNSAYTLAEAQALTVHPRVCGELAAPWSAGDSHPRFIPACAGNSWLAEPTRCPSPVHPRVCGELIVSRWETCRLRGSSPRVRGTRTTALRNQRTTRFIPACAGNSHKLPLGRGQ